MHEPRPNPTLLFLCFLAVYTVWGSSFAASKLVVRDLPPLSASGVRFLAAGVGLALVARWRGARIPERLREWRHVAVMAFCLVVLANGCNSYALRYLASSESALLNASAALWIPVLGALGRHGHPLGRRAITGLALGFAGVALLLWPEGGLTPAHLGATAIVLFGCFAWAFGTLYYRRISPLTPPLMFSAMQMLVGGAVLLAIGLGNHDAAHWHLTAPSLGGLVFLIVASSGVTYTAFVYLMRNTTPTRLATYAYVNPAVAALVGWAFLGERLSTAQLAGTVIVLAGVVLISLPDPRRGADAAAGMDEPSA